MDMQASITGNIYQCVSIDTYSKYVWTYFIVTKDEVYNIFSDLCETEIVKLWGRDTSDLMVRLDSLVVDLSSIINSRGL